MATGRRRHALRVGLAIVALAAALVVLLAVSRSLGGGALPRVSPSGTDEGDCRDTPCRTLAYALRAVDPGEVVRVAAGEYGPQTLPADERSGRAVVFEGPDEGAPARFSRIDVRGDRIALHDLDAGRLEIDPKRPGDTADHLTLRGVSARSLYAGAVKDLEIHGGHWGPQDDLPVIQIGSASRVLLDGLDVHDARASGPEVHTECIWAASVDGFVLRDSRLRGCSYFGLFLTRLTGPDPRDVTLERNVFEPTRTYAGVPAPYVVNVANWVRRLEGLTLSGNTFAGAVALQPETIRGGRITGNAGTEAVCHPALAAGRNVWAAGRCGPTDRVDPRLRRTLLTSAGDRPAGASGYAAR